MPVICIPVVSFLDVMLHPTLVNPSPYVARSTLPLLFEAGKPEFMISCLYSNIWPNISHPNAAPFFF